VRTKHLQLVTSKHSVTTHIRESVRSYYGPVSPGSTTLLAQETLRVKPTSSAFGIAQLLRERSGEPELQILHAIRYVEHRYRGSFCSAKRHSDRVGWY